MLDAIEAKLGVSLGEAARNLYRQADGLALVWTSTGDGPRPVRGRPTMAWLEGLSSGGAIALWPVAEVFGLRGAPAVDYARYTADDTSRWGFDFPGHYYTPAFVRVGDELRVQVGDDHGGAWDGPTVPLDRYLENVLASWGSIDAREQQFVCGRGRAIAPVSLASLLRPAASATSRSCTGRLLLITTISRTPGQHSQVGPTRHTAICPSGRRRQRGRVRGDVHGDRACPR